MASQNESLSSKLEFDIGQAVASLGALQKSVNAYTQSIEQNEAASRSFNQEQAKVDKTLANSGKAAASAATGLGKFGAAQSKLKSDVAGVTAELIRQSKAAADLRATFGLGGRNTLKGFADKRNASIIEEETKATERRNKALAEGLKQSVNLNRTNQQAEKSRNKNQLATQEEQLRRAFGRPGRGGGDLPPPLNTKQFDDDAGKLQGGIQKLTISWGALVRIFATKLAFDGLQLVTSQFRDGIKAAIDFETKLAQIQTISKEFKAQGLDATAEAVRNLSDQFGLPIEDVAAGLYESLSNQVGNAAESVFFLGEALEFSKATITSSADSVDLLSGVINSYGLTVASAENISDQLFVTIDKGRVKGEDLANTIGRILPLASALGVDLSEVNAALAELTIQGVTSADAMTQITNVMLKLVKPTEALQAVFDKLGVSSAEAGIAIFGFDGFLREIVKVGGESTTEIGKLFNQIRGTRGVIGIVSRDSEKYAETLRQIRDASSEAASATAAQTVLQTPAQQLTRDLTQLRNFLVNDFGRSAIKVFADFSENVLSVKNSFLLLAGTAGAFVTIIGGAGLIGLVGQAITNFKVLTTTLQLTNAQVVALTGNVGRLALVAGGAALAVGAVLAIQAYKDMSHVVGDAEASINVLNKAIDEQVKSEIRANRTTVEGRKAAIRDAIRASSRQTLELQKQYLKDKDSAFENQIAITSQLEDQLNRRKNLITTALQQLEQAQSKSAENVKKIRDDQVGTEFEENSNKFERDIKNAKGGDLAQALLARSNKVLAAAKEAFAKGNDEFGKQLLGDAFSLANRVADSEDSRAAGEGQINKLLQEQKRINDDLISQEQQKAASAAAAEKSNRNTLLGLNTQIDKFNEINQKINKDKPVGDELNKLLQEREGLAGTIQNQLLKLDPSQLTKFKDLRDIFAELRGGFTDPTTGGQGDFKIITENAGTDLTNTLTKAAREANPEVLVRFKAITGKEIGTGGFGSLLDADAKLLKDATKNIENSLNLSVLQGQVTKAKSEFNGLVDAINTAAEKSSGITQEVASTRKLTDFAFDAPARAAKDFFTKIATLRAQGLKAIEDGDTDGIKAVAEKLKSLQEGAKEGLTAQTGLFGIFGDGNAANTFSEGAGKAADAIFKLAEAQTAFNKARSEDQNFRKLETALLSGDVNELDFIASQEAIRKKNEDVLRELGRLPEVVQDGINAAELALQGYSEQPIIDERNRVLQFMNANPIPITVAPGVVPGGPAQSKSRGGMIHYFNGGGVVPGGPRGTDTQPAWLTPGEVVMNPIASREWYSTLMSMNAGMKPRYFSEGGPVTKNVTNVGDIHVTVNGQGSSVNGRQLAKEMRREVRRRTIRR